MTDQFVKYDGTQWTLGQGVPGPRGPAGLQGPPGPAGTTDGFSKLILGALTSPGNTLVNTHQISSLIFQGPWSTGTYTFQLGEDGVGFTFGNLFIDLTASNFGVGVTFIFQLGTAGATVTLPDLTVPYYMLLWDSAGTYKAVPIAGTTTSQTSSNLVFRPGGTASNNVYTSWSALMAARAGLEGPAIIEIDSSLGTATIPTGSWDLKGNTKIVSRNSSSLSFVSDGTLLNATEFHNLGINFASIASAPFNIDFTSTIGFLRFYDCSITGSTGSLGAVNLGGTIVPVVQLYGNTAFNADVFAYVLEGGNNNISLDLYDSSFVQNATINGAGTTANVNLHSPSAFCNATQTVPNLNIFGWSGGSGGNFPTANVGDVLTKANSTQATWQAGFAAGGDLTGSSNYQIVSSISGTGTSNYTGGSGVVTIRASEQAFYANGFQAHVNSFVIDVGVGGTGSPQVIYQFPAVTTGTMDVSGTIVCVDFSNSLNIYRADLKFTVLTSGGALNTILQSGNPQNVQSNGTLTGVAMYVSNLGNRPAVFGTFPNGGQAKLTVYFQAVWRE